MTRFRKLKPPKADVHQFIDFISQQIDVQRVPLSEVCAKAGISERSVRRWRMGDSLPALGDVERVLQALGFTMVIIKGEKE